MNIPDDVRKALFSEDPEITLRIKEFKDFLNNEDNTIDRALNKFLLFGIPFLFRNDVDKFFELKEDIAEYFGVCQTQIYMVGSAKFGFSISPSKRYKYFADDSDIDIAVIDEKTFNDFWRRLYSYNINLKSRTEQEQKEYESFLEYFFRGWIRPDKFPVKYKKDWFEYFKKLNKKYGYKVRVGLYKDSEFFTDYHKKNFEDIRSELKYGK